jgi:hypothetical protein
MKAKIITFKPNKSGETTLYLGEGIDLRELIDLIGQEVNIEPAQPIAPKCSELGKIIESDKQILAILNAIRTYGRIKYKEGQDILDAGDNIEPGAPCTILSSSSSSKEEVVDIFEFGEGE